MTSHQFFESIFVEYKVITIPLLSVIAVIVLKAVSLPGRLEGDRLKELLHFGGSLRNSGLMYMITSVGYQTQLAFTHPPPQINSANSVLVQNFLILVYILTALILSLLLRNYGHDKSDKMMIGWIVVSDIIGIGMLLMAIWFIG